MTSRLERCGSISVSVTQDKKPKADVRPAANPRGAAHPDKGSMYSRPQIEMARRRQEVAARVRGSAFAMHDGCRTMQIDTVLFHNARIANQRDYKVQNCWSEPEFCADMVRRHPELGVKCLSRNPRVRIPGDPVNLENTGRLTRHGRVTFHKTYADSHL